MTNPIFYETYQYLIIYKRIFNIWKKCNVYKYLRRKFVEKIFFGIKNNTDIRDQRELVVFTAGGYA